MNLKFRDVPRYDDIESVGTIVESTGFFYDIEIPLAVELINEATNGNKDYKFIFVDDEETGQTVAYSCFGFIDGTIGGFDLYWIVVHNKYRGCGIGKKLLEKTHEKVIEMGGRYLIAETSSIEKYFPTRNFYLQNGYISEARIKNFYRIGDDKIFFVKNLVPEKSKDELLLEKNGWVIVNNVPFEIKYVKSGDTATGVGAQLILDSFRHDDEIEEFFDIDIEDDDKGNFS